MKLPEDEQKAYEHYKDDLHYQASMFESSFGDGYYEGKTIGIEQGIEQGIQKGIEQTTKSIALKLLQQGAKTKNIAALTGLSIATIENIKITHK
jgi:predicted transposase/invertase (TIGR01784 family)